MAKSDDKIISVINYDDDNSTLVYRHPSRDFNIGSQLIVHQSQEAILFKDGKALETFGPGRHVLETKNFPLLKNAINALANGKSVFHSEVYFINLTTQLGIKWGTDSKIRMFDPVSGLHLEIGASGTFNIKIDDGRKLLLKVVGTSPVLDPTMIFGSTYSAVGLFRGMVVSKVKTTLARVIRENDINILEVDEHIDELSECLKHELNKVFGEYGLNMPEFFIVSIQTPDDDPNFKRLKAQHAERYLRIREARIEKDVALEEQGVEVVRSETQKKKAVIKAEAEAEVLVKKGEAEAEVMRLKGYTYQDETMRIVGTAAASNEGGGGSGVASDVVKAAVGLGVGVAVAGKVVETVKPILNQDGSWECPNCHHKGNKGLYCESCGAKSDQIDGWECPECHQKRLTGNFCPNCGHKKGE